MERDGQGAVGLDVARRGEVGRAGPVGLRRGRDVDRRLGERVLGLGQADPVERLAGGDGDLESALGSAFPTSSLALMIRRRAMNFGSSPAAIIAASQ